VVEKTTPNRSFSDRFFYKERVEGNIVWFPRPLQFAVIIYMLIALWTCWYIVDKDQNGVIQLFGEYVRIGESGMNGKLPWPFETVKKVIVTKAENLEIGFRTVDENAPTKTYEEVDNEALMLTGDQNIVDLDFIVQYRRSNASRWLFGITDPEQALRLLAQSSMRFTVGHNPFDDVATFGRGLIQSEVQTDLGKLCTDLNFGPGLAGVQLQDAHPPASVMPDFKDVTNAKEEKERMIRSAEGYKNDIIPRARGQAKQLVENALGYESERVQNALGDSARFVDILREYKRDPKTTETRLRLETLHKVLPYMNQWIIKSEQGPLQLLNLQGGK